MDFSKYNKEVLEIPFDEEGSIQLIRSIANRVGMKVTEQQIKVAMNADRDAIVKAGPGSGKTSTLKLAVLCNSIVKKIPISQMTIISFTKATVKEFKRGLKDMQKKLTASHVYNVRTFHSLLLEYITLLRGEKFQVISDREKHLYIGEQKTFVSRWLREYKPKWADNGDVDHFLPHLLTSLKNTNSFSEASISANSNFKKLQEITDFDLTEKDIMECLLRYIENLVVTKRIMQVDYPAVAVYLQNMAQFDEETKQLVEQSRLKYVFVDEFQDLSVMELEVLHAIAENIIAIGDPDQSIYGFKGADSLIFDRFRQLRPDCVDLPLSRSFRCSQASAEDNHAIIVDNYRNASESQPYEGTDKEYTLTHVEFETFLKEEMPALIEKLKQDAIDSIQRKQVESNFILFRNNIDVFLMMHEFVQAKLPFNLSKAYEGIFNLNGVSSYMHIIRALMLPENQASMFQLSREANWDNMKKTFSELPIKLIYGSGKTYMDIKTEEEYIEDLRYIAETMKAQNMDSSTPIINYLMFVYEYYDKHNLNTQKSLYDERVRNYHRLIIETLIGRMSFDELMIREGEVKSALSKEYESNIMLSTFHSAKGLEADNVIIMNISDGIFPNEQVLEKTLKINPKDAAMSLIQERNLLYVARTRAKKSLKVVYLNKLSSLIEKDCSSDLILRLNEYIKNLDIEVNEVQSFKEVFTRLKKGDFDRM